MTCSTIKKKKSSKKSKAKLTLKTQDPQADDNQRNQEKKYDQDQGVRTESVAGRAKVIVATSSMLRSRTNMTSVGKRSVQIVIGRPKSDFVATPRLTQKENSKGGMVNQPNLSDGDVMNEPKLSDDVILPEIAVRNQNSDIVPSYSDFSPVLPSASPAVEATNQQVMMEVVEAKSKSYQRKKAPVEDRLDTFLKTREPDRKKSVVLPQISSTPVEG